MNSAKNEKDIVAAATVLSVKFSPSKPNQPEAFAFCGDYCEDCEIIVKYWGLRAHFPK